MDEKPSLEVMYFHGTTIDGCRYTIAGIVEDPYLNMGIAICGELDKFVKSKGRAIATERLLSQRNNKGIGKSSVHLYADVEGEKERYYFVNNEFKTFTEVASKCNGYTKKTLQKVFNLFNHPVFGLDEN